MNCIWITVDSFRQDHIHCYRPHGTMDPTGESIQVQTPGMDRLAREGVMFDRMRAERAREAMGYRSEGEEAALKIRAETDLEAASIQAEAFEEAQGIRGQGDAEALRIYAAAYKNAERFYQFVRTLEAYERALDEKTTLVLPADSDFFRFVKGMK